MTGTGTGTGISPARPPVSTPTWRRRRARRPNNLTVTDTKPANAFAAGPAIDISNFVNTQDADTARGRSCRLALRCTSCSW
jgi:hypothetical protein